jgi:hypothetical protein
LRGIFSRYRASGNGSRRCPISCASTTSSTRSTILNGAERDLTPLTQDPRPANASQAYDLLAVLYFRSAYPGSGTDPGLLAEAVSDLQNAVRVDPSNETAKENLELAMRVLIAKPGGRLKVPGSGTRATNKRRGSDALPPGGGF